MSITNKGTLFAVEFLQPPKPTSTPYTPEVSQLDPEKRWLEDYIPIGKVTFQGLC